MPSPTTDVANRDPYVCQVLTDVLHLVAPPTALMRPRVVARVCPAEPAAEAGGFGERGEPPAAAVPAGATHG